jgi:hypothetical protein
MRVHPSPVRLARSAAFDQEAALEGLYRGHTQRATAITPHLSRLRQWAAGCALAVEFGVRDGASTTALLLGAQHVISYDLVATPAARRLQIVAGDRWDYRLEDSRTATMPGCDLLFLDSLHSYAQVRAELTHAPQVRKYLVFHDTITFGSIAADGETGRQAWMYVPGTPVPPEHLGIRPAIDDLMLTDRAWRLAAHYTDSHGLLVLERCP